MEFMLSDLIIMEDGNMLLLIQEFLEKNKQDNLFSQEDLLFNNFGLELFKKRMQNYSDDIKL